MRAGIIGLTMLSTLALTACGGDGGDGDRAASTTTRSPAALVADAFDGSHAVSSGRLSLEFEVDAKDDPSFKGMSISLRGPFELGREGSLPKFDLDLDVDTGSTKVSAGAISTGDRVWLQYAGSSFVLPSSLVEQLRSAYRKAEKRSDGSAKAPTLASLGVDPRRWLKDPRIVGEETVGGDKTTHVTADVDVAKLIDDVAALTAKAGALGSSTTLGGSGQTTAVPKLSAKDRRDIERALTGAKLDIWTGVDDNVLRRLRAVVAFDVPAEARSRAGGLTTGSFALNIAIADLNDPQTIAAPGNARPFSELQPLLSGLLGA